VAGGNGPREIAGASRASPAGPGERLWRARRRHDYIDALLRDSDAGSVLEFRRNGRSLVTWRFGTRDEASAEAMRRLRDLQRAGWNTHW
jgi:hypothetical protein